MQNEVIIPKFSNCNNFRELGGLPVSGGVVRHGVFWRSPALFPITSPEDRAEFSRLGIRTILDFRGDSVRRDYPDPEFPGASYIGICAATSEGAEVKYGVGDMAAGGMPAINAVVETVAKTYYTMPFDNEAYRLMFQCLLESRVPILFHCTSGKDRTGIAAMLILKALGASDETVISDYMRTNENPVAVKSVLGHHYEAGMASPWHKEIADAVQIVYEENIRTAMKCIRDRYGSFRDYFLQEFSLDDASIQKLRSLYVERTVPSV